MSVDLKRPRARPYLEATKAFQGGSDSPRKFLERCIGDIEAREADVMAFVVTDLAGARAAADRSTERWRAGKPLSSIDGMPVGVKDIIETIDMPTGNGSALFAGERTNRDAATVKALREAGCVIVGKTVTTEFASSEPGPTRNPWDIQRTPGGSSSGSAAGVAAGFCSAALGTQVIGSILRPASYCGVVGYKPTIGAINRGGSHDALSHSAHGVIAATLADTWQVAREVGDRCGGDPGYPGLYGPAAMPEAKAPRALALLRTEGWPMAEPEAVAALEAALERLRRAGIIIHSAETSQDVAGAEAAIADAMALARDIIAFESRWPLNTYRDRDAGKLSKHMLARLIEAEGMTLAQYRQNLAKRDAARAAYAKLAGIADGIVTLAAIGAAPVGLRVTGNAVFVVAGSVLGVPTLTLPLLACSGLPLGLQVMGMRDRDGELFATAAHVERVVGTDLAISAFAT